MRNDVQRARRLARALIVIAVVYGLVGLFMWVASPGYMGPMFTPWYLTALPITGVASYFLGLALMVRIYRADPEPGARTWRYRGQ